MMLRRRCAKPTCPRSWDQTPASSGPRCWSRTLMTSSRRSRSGIGLPRRSMAPLIPHMGVWSSGGVRWSCPEPRSEQEVSQARRVILAQAPLPARSGAGPNDLDPVEPPTAAEPEGLAKRRRPDRRALLAYPREHERSHLLKVAVPVARLEIAAAAGEA